MILWCIFVDYIVKIYYFEFVVFFVVFWLDMSKVDLMEGVVLKVVRVEWGQFFVGEFLVVFKLVEFFKWFGVE